jgi:uncharacterized damage-inducible protein DinB
LKSQEKTISIAQSLLAEFEQELVATRRCLERIPEDRLGWQPHPKSMSLGQLGLHIATTPAGILNLSRPDVTPPPVSAGAPQAESTAQIMAALDATVEAVRRELAELSDERLLATWRLADGERELFAIPRVAFLRSVMLNHWYHHRGQLTVYLRLLDVPVPAIYGGSADEKPAFMS